MVEGLATTPATGLVILIADDNATDQLILKKLVTRQGHIAITASDGKEALARFAEHNIDLILLDALMPVMDGFEVARQVRQILTDELVPIIFLTSLTDAVSLAQCLEAGGNDFLSKPYNPVILEAKINAFSRMRLMHRVVQSQRDQILEHNAHLLQEQETAKEVFDRITHMGCLEAENIQYLLSPMSVFNGDVLLAGLKPSGDMHILLGDFTGHGLPAAIGAMPLAEIFYDMTANGYALKDVVREINTKLKRILPVGLFCAAEFIEVKFDAEELVVWKGGLPNSYLIRGEDVLTVESNHLPLGIAGPESFNIKTQKFSMRPGDRYVFCSDGVTEARNLDGGMYGSARLESVIRAGREDHCLFNQLKEDITHFVGQSSSKDDLSLVVVSMLAAGDIRPLVSRHMAPIQSGPTNWEMRYRLKGDSLINFDPIPPILQMVLEVPGLRQFNGEIFTVLSELYSNALEHGVLGLDSALKKDAAGFSEYYRLREQRQYQIREEFITIDLTHTGDSVRGKLTICVEDSGRGFLAGNAVRTSSKEILERMRESDRDVLKYSGRGISLLNSLCQRVEYIDTGNVVEVDYDWQLSRKDL